jgi:hypothetical protein
VDELTRQLAKAQADAIRIEQEVTQFVTDLEDENKSLKANVTDLEDENESLKAKNAEQRAQHHAQIIALQKSLGTKLPPLIDVTYSSSYSSSEGTSESETEEVSPPRATVARARPGTRRSSTPAAAAAVPRPGASAGAGAAGAAASLRLAPVTPRGYDEFCREHMSRRTCHPPCTWNASSSTCQLNKVNEMQGLFNSNSLQDQQEMLRQLRATAEASDYRFQGGSRHSGKHAAVQRKYDAKFAKLRQRVLRGGMSPGKHERKFKKLYAKYSAAMLSPK